MSSGRAVSGRQQVKCARMFNLGGGAGVCARLLCCAGDDDEIGRAPRRTPARQRQQRGGPPSANSWPAAGRRAQLGLVSWRGPLVLAPGGGGAPAWRNTTGAPSFEWRRQGRGARVPSAQVPRAGGAPLAKHNRCACAVIRARAKVTFAKLSCRVALGGAPEQSCASGAREFIGGPCVCAVGGCARAGQGPRDASRDKLIGPRQGRRFCARALGRRPGPSGRPAGPMLCEHLGRRRARRHANFFLKFSPQLGRCVAASRVTLTRSRSNGCACLLYWVARGRARGARAHTHTRAKGEDGLLVVVAPGFALTSFVWRETRAYAYHIKTQCLRADLLCCRSPGAATHNICSHWLELAHCAAPGPRVARSRG